jgi:hypothetical protein
MTKAEIEAALNRALDKLVERDMHLLDVNASERSMSHRLAVYLADESSGYSVDCEYNRDGFNAKELRLDAPEPKVSPYEIEAVTVFPDIIVHRRGTNDHNLLVVEIKKASSSRNSDFDRQKLRAFCEELRYTWAAHVIIGQKRNGEVVRCVEWIN